MIGTQWESPRGTRRVESMYDETRYLVRTGADRFRDIMDSADIASAQRLDAANLAFRARQAAEREARETAERERIAADPVEQYLATLPPMKAGRARKSLLGVWQRVNGSAPAPRGRNVQRLIGEGYRLNSAGNFQRAGESSFLSGKDFTTYGVELARFLETSHAIRESD